MSDDTPVRPKWYHFIAMLPVFVLLRLWQASIRFAADPHSLEIMRSPQRMIGLAWHDSIFFLPMSKWAYRKKFPMSGLVSASRDGSYLCAYFKFCGIRVVRGSSRKRASASIVGLIDALKHGSDIFITPDGPIGPKHVAKPGFLGIAEEASVRILLLHFSPRSFRRLSTWDSFMLPMPFSRVEVRAFEFKDADSLISAAEAAGVSPQEYAGRFMSKGSFD